MKDNHITIAGAGLVGSLMAILLAKRGYKIDVYERRPDMRNFGFKGGRSINLAMSDRGWKALEQAGIKDQIRKVAIPMRGRMMHSVNGELTFQPYGKEGQAIYSVSRGGLNLELLKLAENYDHLNFHFDHRCKGINLQKWEISFENTQTKESVVKPIDVCLGADGAFSAVRSSLQKTARFNYSQTYLEYGYKELTIPPNEDGSHRMDPNALHIWPRGSFMLIALPNVDGSFTCTLFLAYEGKVSFENLQTDEQILAFFNEYFSDTIPLITELLQDFHQNPTADLVTIRCNPWEFGKRILLIGDASHAIVPFYGQGMNSGFEDCSILDQMIDEQNGDWEKIIEHFNKERVKDGHAIADLALRNFVEMRDWVGHPRFLLRKKLEAHLYEKFPDAFMPVYSMVTFSHQPYHKAWQEISAQDTLFDQLLDIEDIETNFDKPQAEDIFKDWVAQRVD